MQTTNGTHLTRWGFKLLADALAGRELKFVNVKLGDSVRDGETVYPSREEAYEFDDLINAREFLPEGEAPFVSIDRIGGGQVSISFMIRNAYIKEALEEKVEEAVAM